MAIFNLLLCGIGGQGIVLAGRMIATVAFKSGLEVRESEIHGMSQRGGTVTGHVRFGKRVFSPTIPVGRAELMLALEELEALRYSYYLKPLGTIILNAKKILPSALPEDLYPQDIEERLKRMGYQVYKIPAGEIANDLGSTKVENTVLLGALSNLLPFAHSLWEEVIRATVPPKFVELNLKAFCEGKKIGRPIFQS